jgi:hypothetical protein
MLKEWDPNMPVELIFTQIEEGQEFADEGGQPYTNQQVLNMAFNITFHTSPFKCACCKWRESPDAKKMWNNFKIHFAIAQTELAAERALEGQMSLSKQIPQQSRLFQSKRYDFIQSPIDLNLIIKFDLSLLI